jgi:hypothetical protein
MADQEIKLRVSVDGGTTIGDMRKHLKSLNAELNNVAVSNIPLQKKLGAEIVKVKDTIASATSSTVTANGKMMQSYFKTGEELRRFYREQRLGDRTMREATQTVQVFGTMLGDSGLGKSLGTAIAGFQQAEFAVSGLGIAAQGAGGKFAVFGASLAAAAAPIAIAAAAIGGLVWWMGEMKKSAASLAGPQGEFIASLMGKARAGNAKDAIEDLRQRIAALRAAGDTEGLKAFGVTMTDDTGFWSLRYKLLIENAKATKALAEEEKKRNSAAFDPGDPKGAKATEERWAGMRGARGLEKGKLARERAGKRAGQPGTMFEPAEESFSAFEQSVLSGTDAMANSVGQIGQAFAQMFGGANTLLGSFAQAFASTMSQLAANYAIGSLLTLIGGPFGGIGATMLAGFSGKAGGGPIQSGKPYVVGERGPELFFPRVGGEVMSHSKSLQFSRSGNQPIVLETRISGNDLVLVQAKSSLNRRGRQM